MATTPLSSANSGYLNSILNNTYKAPAPQVTTESKPQVKKEDNGSFSKALLCLAAVGTLAIQAIGCSKKPASVDSSDEIKLINSAIETLKEEVGKISNKISNNQNPTPDTSVIDNLAKKITELSEQLSKISNNKADKDASKEFLNALQNEMQKIQQQPHL